MQKRMKKTSSADQSVGIEEEIQLECKLQLQINRLLNK